MSKVYVGDFVTVGWSNGAGESVYRVVENLVGPASFVLFSEFEYGDDGIDDDDMNAVFADIVARRGVA
tara:strand:+ start:396 stop:599 length:204 start_codon:yes stop_codon:yes gene_type:complete